MQNLLDTLYNDIRSARQSFIAAVSNLSVEQAKFKPSENEWSILEIAEHLVWAEQIGLCGMFNAIDQLRLGRPIWSGESPNEGLSIEEVVAKTWQPKEQVPKVAEPRWGGSMGFWLSGLQNNDNLLKDLMQHAKSIDLTKAIYPHPISGPLNVVQRLEFLAFHMRRHETQAQRVQANETFPV